MAPPPLPFEWMPVIISLACALGLIFVIAFGLRHTDAGKMAAVKLRRTPSHTVAQSDVQHAIEGGGGALSAAAEDVDPDMVVSPIVAMQLQNEKQARIKQRQQAKAAAADKRAAEAAAVNAAAAAADVDVGAATGGGAAAGRSSRRPTPRGGRPAHSHPNPLRTLGLSVATTADSADSVTSEKPAEQLRGVDAALREQATQIPQTAGI